MAAVISGGVTNVILDYIFIFPMNKGMAGAAAATVIGSSLTLAILLTHLFSRETSLKIALKVKWRKAGEILVNGLASFLLETCSGIVMFLFNRQLLAYVGDLGVVVYGIISNSALIAASINNGISQASQPILAMNYGAGKKERLRETRRKNLFPVISSHGIQYFVQHLAPVRVNTGQCLVHLPDERAYLKQCSCIPPSNGSGSERDMGRHAGSRAFDSCNRPDIAEKTEVCLA